MNFAFPSIRQNCGQAATLPSDVSPLPDNRSSLDESHDHADWNVNAGDWATNGEGGPCPRLDRRRGIKAADRHSVAQSTGASTVQTLTMGNDKFVVSGASQAPTCVGRRRRSLPAALSDQIILPVTALP